MGVILSLIVPTLLGGITSYVAQAAYEKRQLRVKSVAEREIFSFGNRELLFVVPHRGREADSIMPRVAVEDVLAMKNILAIAARLGRDLNTQVRDASHLTDDDRKKNIISFGGSKVNRFTAEILDDWKRASFRFEGDSNTGHWSLRRDLDTVYSSPSHKFADQAAPELARDDVGLVLKLRNPNNTESLVLVIAGIRGIGTWGATDCLRKHIQDVHAKKRGDSDFKKTGEFSMVIAAKYAKFDIKETHIRNFEDYN